MQGVARLVWGLRALGGRGGALAGEGCAAGPALSCRSFATDPAGDSADREKQLKLDADYVRDRRAWKGKLKELRKQYAVDWENLDKSVLRKAKPKRKEGYQPLNREALAASARQRWLENEERKSKLRELEEGWARAKKARADKLDVVMDAVKSQRKAAEARRMLWLLERSEEWIPEENLDLAIAAAILEPTEF